MKFFLLNCFGMVWRLRRVQQRYFWSMGNSETAWELESLSIYISCPYMSVLFLNIFAIDMLNHVDYWRGQTLSTLWCPGCDRSPIGTALSEHWPHHWPASHANGRWKITRNGSCHLSDPCLTFWLGGNYIFFLVFWAKADDYQVDAPCEYVSVGKCPGLGHHLQMVASENRQRWNSAVNVPEWQVLIFISWTSIFLYYSLNMLRLYVFHWLFAPAIEHSLELPCFNWVTYLSHVPWSSHMADIPKGMVMPDFLRPRTPELAALAIQQLLDRDVGGRPILVKDRGGLGKRGHGWPWDISEMNGSW